MHLGRQEQQYNKEALTLKYTYLYNACKNDSKREDLSFAEQNVLDLTGKCKANPDLQR